MGASQRKIVVIANPASSRGRNGKRRQILIDALDRAVNRGLSHGIEATYSIMETTSKGEAVRSGNFVPGSGSDLAQIAAADGVDVVAAAGGDGTVGEVANGLVHTPATLGVIPMGTGNDFARTIGVGTDLDLATNTLVFGVTQKIDLGKTDGGYFINIAGCGFDAVVAQRVNRGFRRLRGTAAYLAAVVQTLTSYRPAEIELEVDGAKFNEQVMLCAVSNAKSYGGGMKVAPDAVLNDALFDIVLVGDVTPIEFLRAFPSVFKGTHISHPKVKVLRGRQVTIRADSQLPVLADGEELGFTPTRFEIEPNILSVLAPNEM